MNGVPLYGFANLRLPDQCNVRSFCIMPAGDVLRIKTLRRLPTAEPEWKLLLRQSVGAYGDSASWRSRNPNDPSSGDFSILGQLGDADRGDDGRFLFKLVWPGATGSYSQAIAGGRPGYKHNIWRQSSNPMDPAQSGFVDGYDAVEVTVASDQWGGLWQPENAAALLHGSKSGCDGGTPFDIGPRDCIKLLNPPESARSYSSVFANDPPGKGWARSMLDSPTAWIAKEQKAGCWMEMDLGAPHCVVAIVVQGRGDDKPEQFVRKVRVRGSLDGRTWQDTPDELLATGVSLCTTSTAAHVPVPSAKNQTHRAALPQPQIARFVRLVVTQFRGFPTMRTGVEVNLSAAPGAGAAEEAPPQSGSGVTGLELYVAERTG